MTETIKVLDKETPSYKLHSMRSIMIATFLGSPIAAGFVLYTNLKNLGRAEQGKKAIILGIIGTVAMFAIFFSIPVNVTDRIPNYVIPASYMGIIYLITNKLIGIDLAKHESGGGVFFSVWKSAGIGSIGLASVLLGLFVYTSYFEENFDADKYNNGLEEFTKNENNALKLFEISDTTSTQIVVNFINQVGLPAWKKNIQILYELDKIDGISEKFLIQNSKLREYCELRISLYEIIRKSAIEDTDQFLYQADSINLLIEQKLGEI